MKKIWPWLLLLLLLIIFCVWSKKDSIHLTKHTHLKSTVATPALEEVRYIDYALIQKDDNHYSLEGKFATTQQEEKLKEILSKSKKALSISHTSTNETLQGEPAIALTAKILPHFAEHYSKGKIVYSNQKLSISGVADSYEAQHEMQRLLNTSTLASSDESSVIANTPIEYAIHKNAHNVHAEGILNDLAQVNRIKTHLPRNSTNNFQVKAHHVDHGSLSTVESFLPIFLSKYTKGDIVYNEEKLTISGNVHSQAELKEVNKILSHTSIPVSNHTIVDPDILAKHRAQLAALAKAQKAKKAALAEKEKEKAARVSEETKIAQEKAAKDALLEAKRKAEEAKLLEIKRRAEAERVAQERKRAEAAKEAEMKIKIANLFKVGNIEFNINKSTLTEKGQNTVNNLAKILKEYPSVHIEIAGHTDSDGSAEYNQKLSQSRVDTVKTKLIAQAIESTRLVAKGYGETKPLVPNNSRANKAKNRRVEINILGE